MAEVSALPAPVPAVPRPLIHIEEPSSEIESELVQPSLAPRSHVEEESLVSAAVAHTSQTAVVEPYPVEREETVAVAAPAIVAEPVVSTEPEPAPRAIEPVPVAPALKLDWPSDLVQIETDPSKTPGLAPETANETTPVRQRRPRPAPVQVADEPLVQVETRKPEAA